ncbi:MAG: hypothetical protein VX498_08740, partial [Myxococcota bacterium]|nr:hypothetical protein [Myxococcota bacterium]
MRAKSSSDLLVSDNGGWNVEEIQEQGRQSYAALLFGLHRAGRTGILELHQNRNWRKLYLVRGTPVLYESSIASERLNKTILQAGLVEQKPLSKILSKLQPGEQLEDKLVESKLVGPEELHAHKRVLLERGSAAGLAWTTFKWRFLANDSVGSRIDPALIPDINPLRGLWSAVKQHVTMDEALPFVDDKEAGNILATEDLAAVVEAMELEEPLNQLPDALQGDALSFEDLFSKIHDKSGHLVPLIWLLETVALITRENRSSLEGLAHLRSGQDLAGEEPLLGGSVETKPPSAEPKSEASPTPEAKPAPTPSERQTRTLSH